MLTPCPCVFDRGHGIGDKSGLEDWQRPPDGDGLFPVPVLGLRTPVGGFAPEAGFSL